MRGLSHVEIEMPQHHEGDQRLKPTKSKKVNNKFIAKNRHTGKNEIDGSENEGDSDPDLDEDEIEERETRSMQKVMHQD